MRDRDALIRQAREQPELVADIILEQDKRILALEKRIEELERRLNLNSSNSSKPPSTDGPHVPRKSKKEPSGRKPGGQAGHQAHFRAPFPPERLNEPPKDVIPERCKHCRTPLKGRDPKPLRYQQAELPPMEAWVTEHALHALKCAQCGKMTRAEMPDGVSYRLLGPRLTAVVALLTGCFRTSKREVQVLLKELFSVEVCLGSITRCEGMMTEALAPVMDEALDYARAQPSGNMDETGWREGRKKAWLWTLVTKWVTVFKVHANRNRVAMNALMGNFSGTLTTDRYGTYNSHDGHRQICWAHLKRDFEAIKAMRGKPGNIGKRLLDTAKRMFSLWHKVKSGKLSRRKFRKRLPYYKHQIEDLLREGASMPNGKTARRTCIRLLNLRRHLWTFAHIKDIEPTNNAAERAIRPAVLWRKGSFGTHSEQGSRFAERILTVRASLKKQKGRALLGFLTQACQAALSSKVKPPSLLPIPA